MKSPVTAALFGALLITAACTDGSTDDSDGVVGAGSSTSLQAGICAVPDGVASMARLWNDAALDAIRLDFPAPTVHARNLYHLAASTWDTWRAFEPPSSGSSAIFVDERREAADVAAARNDAISFASYRMLTHRYRLSLARAETRASLDGVLQSACGVPDAEEFIDAEPDSAAAFGWRVADRVIDATFDDGSLERRGYEDVAYEPVNPPLDLSVSGAGDLVDPDRWQPLLLEVALSQNGIPLPGGEQTFIGSNWGDVTTFSEAPSIAGDQVPPDVFSDPPDPPRHADASTAAEFRDAALEVIRASADLEVGVATIDISPAVSGANSLGVDDGVGHDLNPATGSAYEPNVVDAADYYRAIAEYWADGPTSETPPGHWNSLANSASDALPDADRRVLAAGDPVDRLEWDVKLGIALNGGLHDAAVAAWGAKAHFDTVRPITMIRWMSQNGAYDAANPDGLPLENGLVEIITDESAAVGQRHEHLADHLGEVAVRAWRGGPDDPETQTAGIGWILGVDWAPYQRPTFVSPAFASYVSGHSTFSRAGAEVLAAFTGSDFFPGGLLTHDVPKGSLLHEEGPSERTVLTWASYFDAADEAGRSRIWGGIHIPADDRAGRVLGSEVGAAAVERALTLFG